MDVKELRDSLTEISYNLYWSWNRKFDKLFKSVNSSLWDESKHNPVLFLKKVTDDEIENTIKNNSANYKLFQNLVAEYKQYINNERLWGNSNNRPRHLIAYFSAEYGVQECLAIYSGGLGILSGDHCKSASDLGINLVGIGLFYKQGYFTQRIMPDGTQKALFIDMSPEDLPLFLIRDTTNNPPLVEIYFPGRKVYAQIWELRIGRVSIYLLDTDIEKNSSDDKKITYQLYAGNKNREIRLMQEIILGIGGVKALRKLKLSPSVWHINEGHSAFLIFELIKEEIEKDNVPFDEALERVKPHILFTTHTPVKEGHECFKSDLMKKYFKDYVNAVGIDFENFLRLGNFDDTEKMDVFSMTIFALKAASKANAVSKINQDVSKKMWYKVWGNNVNDAPIDYITNGIHHSTWIAEEFDELFKKYISPDWKDRVDELSLWQNIKKIPSSEIWEIHKILKQRLINYVKEQIIKLYTRNNVERKIIEEIVDNINSSILTIGFARRFAPYKRATLIFADEEKLKQIFLNNEKPAQIIFAGKAHPADIEGQQLIKKIYEYTLKKEYRGKIILLENYSMQTARYLIQGSDVWLNNPRKPYEASGTSGQKAAINGVLNCSISDGWWPEAYNQKNGWAIESADNEIDKIKQDKIDSQNLYSVLINQVIPLYYTRNQDDLPEKWIEMMKESIATVMPIFNTHRMLKEYYEKFYSKLK